MAHAKLIITLPEGTWIGDVSREYPEATFRVLAALPGDETGLGLLEIRAADLGAVVAAMEREEGITSLEFVRKVGDEALVQFETTEPLLLLSVRESGIPLEPPVSIVDGRATLEITAPRDRLSQLSSQLDAFGMSFEVEYVHQSLEPEQFLTDRQRRFLSAAVDHGYYETPRECTLTELAGEMGVAKSTASETLHRAEAKVIKRFVSSLSERGAAALR